MAIARRSFAVTADTTANSVTATAPAGVADGDLLLAFFLHGTGSDTSLTAPAGWTAIGTAGVNGDLNGKAWYKVAASEGASYTFTSSTINDGAIMIVSYTGVSTSSPINTSAQNYLAVAAASVTVGVTTTVDNCMLVMALLCDDGDTQTVSWTGSMTEFQDAAYNATFLLVGGAQEQVTSATTYSRVCTKTGTQRRLSAHLIALTPAATGVTLTATTQTYAETGVANTLLRTRIMPAAVQTYTETGVTASLSKGYKLTNGVQTYTVSGVANTFLRGYRVTGVVRTYAESGVATGLLFSRLMSSALGTFTETGITTGLLFKRVMPSSLGTFAETGTPATLLRGYRLSAAAQSYVRTDLDIATALSHLLSSTPLEIILLGTPVTLSFHIESPRLSASAGSYLVTGSNVELHTAKFLVELFILAFSHIGDVYVNIPVSQYGELFIYTSYSSDAYVSL
jgi:hypothetical protein